MSPANPPFFISVMVAGGVRALGHAFYESLFSNVCLQKYRRGMSRGQYPFWKDREIAYETSEKLRYQRELEVTKQRLKNVKCPKCGHVFDIE